MFTKDDIKYMKKHAKHRAKRRYRIKLTNQKHDDIVKKIQSNYGVILEIQQGNKYLCYVDGYFVIYHEIAECLVTFLAPWMAQCRKYKAEILQYKMA